MLVGPQRSTLHTAMTSNFPQIPEHGVLLQTPPTGSFYSPRPAHRARFVPHITICPPEVRTGRVSPDEDADDNEVFLSPVSSPTRLAAAAAALGSDEKHEVHAGSLFLIRHTGSSSSGSPTPPSPSRSPNPWSFSRSPERTSASVLPRQSPTHTSPPSQIPSRSSPSRQIPSRFSPPRQSPTRFSPPVRSPTRSPTRTSASSPPRQSPPCFSSLGQSPSHVSRGSSTSCQKLRVFVRVYRCNHDHFAVMTRDAVHTGKPVYVNLRHCRVLPGDSLGRFMLAGKCDSGHVTEFEVPELSSLESWLDAFQATTPPSSPSRKVATGGMGGPLSIAPPIPKSPTLPPLAETDEEN